jgi:RecB family endonuclease NucS
MVPITEEQKTEILAFLGQGINRHEIAERLGVTPGQVSAVKAVAARGSRPIDIGSDEIVGDAIETTFGLERDLQRALRDRIDQLEPGLVIIDDNKEQTVSSGRIDITARDGAGATVVIELKAGPADRDAIGQILAYMGDLMQGAKSVRGILVAGEFSPRAIAAARAAPNIRLVPYGFSFSFETVSPALSER